MTPAPDTIAAIATPPGRGGVGVIRVSGAAAPAIAAALTGRTLAPREATLATFRGAAGEPLDQGLALLFPAPRSYTGEHVLELHGHGGPAVLQMLLARCLALGARLARPGEFTQRAYLNGKLDLAQAEGVADLIDAATGTAARAAARSLTGLFSREVNALVEALIDHRMRVEAALDFPEEDLDVDATAVAQRRLAALRERLAALLARARQGALLREGLTVVLVGAPNVGKSSLLNQLAGEDVAIVTAIPGTTRDPIARDVAVNGIPLTVVDTAGLRPTDDPIETLGIARTWDAVSRADLVLILADARADGPAPATAAILAQLPATLPRLLVHNKIDLAGDAAVRIARRQDAVAATGDAVLPALAGEVWLSAKTGEGVDLLRQAVLAVANAQVDMEGAFLARERHLIALRAAAGHLDAAAGHLALAVPPLELHAEELRDAQGALSTITGEFTADDLLGVIFSRFCIGK